MSEMIWRETFTEVWADGYVLTFAQLYNEYFPYMCDALNGKVSEPTGKYEAIVRKYRVSGRTKIATRDGYRTGEIDKETANKIYWNVKNRGVSLEDCRRYFAQLAGKELRAR